MDERLVAEVEAAAYRAWRSAEWVDLEGWRLHASGGFSRRGNSAAPPPEGNAPGDALGAIRRWYQERNLSLVVRITPLVEQFDAVLADLGFTSEGVTDVMTTQITDGGIGGVAIASTPSADWISAQERLQGVPADLRSSWEGIINRIDRPAGFALHFDEGSPVAAGLAVRDDPWVGLFEINVASAHRRRGLGRSLSNALLHWGAATGARRAYLQVVHDNEPAKALYRSLGFTPAYRYWYRRAPVS